MGLSPSSHHCQGYCSDPFFPLKSTRTKSFQCKQDFPDTTLTGIFTGRSQESAPLDPPGGTHLQLCLYKAVTARRQQMIIQNSVGILRLEHLAFKYEMHMSTDVNTLHKRSGKDAFCHHLLTLLCILFHTCVTFCLLWNTKEYF